MLPAKRRDDRRRDFNALALEFNNRLFEVACIPQDKPLKKVGEKPREAAN